jgi:hypothetical protein
VAYYALEAHTLAMSLEDADAAAMWVAYYALEAHTLAMSLEAHTLAMSLEIAAAEALLDVTRGVDRTYKGGVRIVGDDVALLRGADKRVRNVKADRPASHRRALQRIVNQCAACLVRELQQHRKFDNPDTPWCIPAAKNIHRGNERAFVASVVWRILVVGLDQLRHHGLNAAVEVMTRIRYLPAWHVAGTKRCQRTERGALNKAVKPHLESVCCATVKYCPKNETPGCTEGFPSSACRTAAHMMSAAGLFLVITCKRSNNNEERINVAILDNPNCVTHYFGPRR